MSISKNTPKTGTLASGNQALTASYVTHGGVITSSGYDQLILYVDYTKGDETDLRYKIQFSDTQAFTDAFEGTVFDTSATGVSDTLDNEFKKTATGKLRVIIPINDNYIRFQAKATAGTPTGTFNARYRLENSSR